MREIHWDEERSRESDSREEAHAWLIVKSLPQVSFSARKSIREQMHSRWRATFKEGLSVSPGHGRQEVSLYLCLLKQDYHQMSSESGSDPEQNYMHLDETETWDSFTFSPKREREESIKLLCCLCLFRWRPQSVWPPLRWSHRERERKRHRLPDNEFSLETKKKRNKSKMFLMSKKLCSCSLLAFFAKKETFVMDDPFLGLQSLHKNSNEMFLKLNMFLWRHNTRRKWWGKKV